MADQYYKVHVSDRALELGSAPDELHLPIGQQETISIIPVMAGAGTTGRIIAGVLLVAVAIAFPLIGATAAQIAAGMTISAISANIALVGVSLIIGGVAQLLTPTPKVPQGADNQDDPRKSYSFSGIQNTSRQGVPVPIVYGETIVGSVVISAGIDTVQVAA